MPHTNRPTPAALADPRIVALKRWDWAGVCARWEWRYLVNGSRQPWTIARVLRRYSAPLGHARVHRLLDSAQRAYREPDGIPADILLGRSVLVPSTPPGTALPTACGDTP